jgi:hypothetical protein
MRCRHCRHTLHSGGVGHGGCGGGNDIVTYHDLHVFPLSEFVQIFKTF